MLKLKSHILRGYPHIAPLKRELSISCTDNNFLRKSISKKVTFYVGKVTFHVGKVIFYVGKVTFYVATQIRKPRQGAAFRVWKNPNRLSIDNQLIINQHSPPC